MPTSKIETELSKTLKIKQGDDDRQVYLADLVGKGGKLADAAWDKLSEPAQEWLNAGIIAVKAKKRVVEFPDVGDVDPDADADDGDEVETPSKKKKAAVDDEAPARSSKKKTKAAAEDEESEDDEPAGDDDEAADEEEPAPKKIAKKKKAAAADEDEESADDEPKKKKAAVPVVPQKASGVKAAIKDAVLDNPEVSVDDIVKKLGKGGASVSKVTVSNVRAEFRHSLKHLKERGKLKGVEL